MVRPFAYDIQKMTVTPISYIQVIKYEPNGDSSPVEVSYKEERTCNQEFPKHFADIYQLFDKICAGFDNGTAGLCIGNSGKGLFVQKGDRYHILGIVSLGPRSSTSEVCHHNSLYTNVSYYYDFIDNALSQYE